MQSVQSFSGAAIAIIWACFALVLLSTVVAARMLGSRVAEMKAKKIHPQTVATSGPMANLVTNTQAADNFRNLFEVPVLFYAWAATVLALGLANPWYAAGAWAFVIARCLHSYIHCTYNKVMHRLRAFVFGCTVVVLLWLGLALQVTWR